MGMEAAQVARRVGIVVQQKQRWLAELWWEQSGLTTVEYALLLMIMVGGIITIWGALGSTVSASATHSVGEIPRP